MLCAPPTTDGPQAPLGLCCPPASCLKLKDNAGRLAHSARPALLHAPKHPWCPPGPHWRGSGPELVLSSLQWHLPHAPLQATG